MSNKRNTGEEVVNGRTAPLGTLRGSIVLAAALWSSGSFSGGADPGLVQKL